MDKDALVRWLQLRLHDYRTRSFEAEHLHLDTRAAEVSALLNAVEQESYLDEKRHERPDRKHEQAEVRGEAFFFRRGDDRRTDGSSTL